MWKMLLVQSLLLRAREEYSVVASLGLQWYAVGNLTSEQYTRLVGR